MIKFFLTALISFIFSSIGFAYGVTKLVTDSYGAGDIVIQNDQNVDFKNVKLHRHMVSEDTYTHEKDITDIYNTFGNVLAGKSVTKHVKASSEGNFQGFCGDATWDVYNEITLTLDKNGKTYQSTVSTNAPLSISICDTSEPLPNKFTMQVSNQDNVKYQLYNSNKSFFNKTTPLINRGGWKIVHHRIIINE